MPRDNVSIVLRHALENGQVTVQAGQLRVADNASRLTLEALRVAGGQEWANPGVVVDLGEPGVLPRAILQAMAEQKIRDKYAQIGGYTSPLGLPVTGDIKPKAQGSGYVMECRGGTIEIEDPTRHQPRAIKRLNVEVWWVALECQVRQEKTDEVYGAVAALAPGSGLSTTHKFPGDREYWELGGEGQRIVTVGVPVYSGPPMDLVLIGSLVEHDSGNTDEYKRKIAEKVAEAARGLGAMAGVPAEAAAADQGFINDLSLGLVNAISSALGADDDPYVPQTETLRWTDIVGRRFQRRTLRRDDDPRTAEYTHHIIVSGTDQGGDRGVYAFYFDLRLFQIEEVS